MRYFLFTLSIALSIFKAVSQPQKITNLSILPTQSTGYLGDYFFNQGSVLWVSNGIDEGTEPVKDLVSQIRELIVAGDRLFAITGTSSAQDLWISDGTTTGTILIKSSISFTLKPSIIAHGGNYYFIADDGITGLELWKTNGTAEGTDRITDLNPGSGSGLYYHIVSMGDFLYFPGDDGSGGLKIYKSNGTSTGTTILEDFSELASVTLFYAVTPLIGVVDGKLIFAVSYGMESSPNNSIAIYSNNGTPESTTLIKDMAPEYYEDVPVYGFYNHLNKLFFTLSNGGAYHHFWVTDGTSEGTVLLEDQIFHDGGITRFTPMLSKLAFMENAQNGITIWLSDGTVSGTSKLVPLLNAYGADENKMAAVDNSLFFSDHLNPGPVGSPSGYFDYELFQSTPSVAVPVKDLPGAEGTYFNTRNLSDVGNAIYFTTGDSTNADIVNLYIYKAPFLPVVTGNKNNILDNKLLFPNPFKDEFILNMPHPGTVSVLDIFGNMVYSIEFKEGQNIINLADLKSGVYFVKVKDETKMIKVIKQ